MAAPGQLVLDALEVVELPVDDDLQAPVLAGNRLVPGRQVDDAQPRVAQADAMVGVHPGALTIRAPVGQPLGGAMQLFRADRTRRRKHSHDAAHCSPSTENTLQGLFYRFRERSPTGAYTIRYCAARTARCIWNSTARLARYPWLVSVANWPQVVLTCRCVVDLPRETNVVPTREEYERKILALGWPDLLALWDAVKVRDTPDWGAGKAFEYLVLRAFDLDGAVVRWPYGVSLYGQTEIVEEIDGSVRVGALYSLIESKDENGDIAIAPIAKLRNQLLRRPAGTFGMVFSSHGFTDPARQLAHFALPQSILLWTGDEVEYALNQQNICELCEMKYRMCVDHGMVDFDVTTGAIV